VATHVLASMVGPIALVEALAGRRGQDPWLSRPMVMVCVLLYLGASALVYADMLSTEGGIASPGQLVGAGVAALLLVAAAVRLPRFTWDRGASRVLQRPRSSGTPGSAGIPAPSPWLVAPLACVVGLGTQLLPPSPLGTDALVAVYAVSALVVWWLGQRADWSPAHVAALATGWLTAFAVGAFWTYPIGSVSTDQKLAHNLALLALVFAVGILAIARAGPARSGASAGQLA
jgi:hypothetical protein